MSGLLYDKISLTSLFLPVVLGIFSTTLFFDEHKNDTLKALLIIPVYCTCIETLPVHQEEVQKTDAQLIKKQEEIARYSRLKTTLYESLSDGLINKAEYLELKAGYDIKIADAQAASEKLKEELECLLQNRTGSSLWIEQFKKHRNITELRWLSPWLYCKRGRPC